MNIFVIIDGDQRGPLTASELRGLLQSGQIQPDTPALREGDDNWSTVSKFARLPDGDAPAGGTESGGRPGALPCGGAWAAAAMIAKMSNAAKWK